MMRRLSYAAALAATSFLVVPSAVANTPLEAQQARVSDLESEAGRINSEVRELGGGRSASESINNVRTRMNELGDQINRLEGVTEQMGKTREELEALREQVANEPIITLGDVAQEGGEQIGERAVAEGLKRAGKQVAGKALGWVALAGDVVQYGGKWVIRKINTADIRKMVNDQTIRLGDVFRLISALLTEQNDERRKLARLEELKKQERANFAELARQRQRLQLMSEPATRHARTGREMDNEGDAQLQREANRDGVRLSNPQDAPPRRRGVWLSEPQSMAPRQANDVYITAAPALVFGTWQGPRPVYLGFENAALVQRFNVENLETDDDFTGFDFHLAAGLPDRMALHLGINTYDVSFSGASERLDPLGQDLLFPGVTSAGFALAPGVAEGMPNGFNVVEGLGYRYNADSTTLYGALSRSYDCEHANLIGYGGIAYSFGNQMQRLDGRVPGFGPGFDFYYDTQFRIETTRGMVGGRATVPVSLDPRFRVNAGATAFFNFADASGIDVLDLNGTVEQLDIGRNEFTFGYAAGVGAEFEYGATTFFANYRFVDDDTVPIAVRHDDGPSHAEFENAQAHTGMLGARLSF